MYFKRSSFLGMARYICSYYDKIKKIGGHRIQFFNMNSFMKRKQIDFFHNPYIFQYKLSRKAKIHAMFENP